MTALNIVTSGERYCACLRQPLETRLLVPPLHVLPQRQHKRWQAVCRTWRGKGPQLNSGTSSSNRGAASWHHAAIASTSIRGAPYKAKQHTKIVIARTPTAFACSHPGQACTAQSAVVSLTGSHLHAREKVPEHGARGTAAQLVSFQWWQHAAHVQRPRQATAPSPGRKSSHLSVSRTGTSQNYPSNLPNPTHLRQRLC